MQSYNSTFHTRLIESEAHAAVMEQNYDGATLTPKHIVDAFKSAYRKVYGREAQVVHMFAEWYTVNGETVHRVTLFSETARLSDFAKQQQAMIAQKEQEQFIQQMWYAEQQAQAQYEQEQLAQQQFATQQAGLALQPEAQLVQPQRQPAKPNAERGMIQRLIARLRGA